MRARATLAAILGLTLFFAACGGDEAATSPNGDEPAGSDGAGTSEGGTTGQGGNGERLVSADGHLEVHGSGRSLEVTIEALVDAPPAPGGWVLTAPVFEITARDRGAAVSRLSEPLELRFEGDGLATVLYFNGEDWEIVLSTLEDDGSVSASVAHLSAYSAGRPANAGSLPTTAEAAAAPSHSANGAQVPTPQATFTRPSVTVPAGNPRANVTPPALTPGATLTAVAFTPGTNATAVAATAAAAVTVTVNETDPATAAAALEVAIELYKQRPVIVTAAGGYTAGGAVALPAALSSLVSSVAASGTLYYGIYGGINEAVTSDVNASSGTGSFTFLAEPKTSMPATSDAALTALLASFPGADGHDYSAVTTSAGGYAFSAVEGDEAYVIGYVEYEGVAIAYLCAGSGSYYGATLAFAAP